MGLVTPNVHKLEKERDIAALVKCLAHKKPNIRIEALHALLPQAKTDRTILDKLIPLASDTEPKVKIEAILRLAQIGYKDIVQNLRYVIANGSKSEKIEALRVLAYQYTPGDDYVSNILVLALKDKMALVQMEAMKTMGVLKDGTAVIHLADMLHDRRHAMRVEAVTALGNIGTPNAIDQIIGSLMDKYPEVRKAARDALERINSDRTAKAVNDAPFMLLVKRMNASVASRIETIKHIGKQRITEGLPLLRKACSDEYKNVRIESIRAIGLFKDKGSIQVLARCIEDSFWDVRLEAAQTLAKIVSDEALSLLEKTMNDQNKNVREEAKKAYYHLFGRLEKHGIIERKEE